MATAAYIVGMEDHVHPLEFGKRAEKPLHVLVIHQRRAKMMTATKAQTSGVEFDPKLLLSVLTAVKKGDFSARMPLDWTGIHGKIADTLNDIIDLEDKVSRGLDRVSKTVGKEGKLEARMSLGSADGAWARKVESVNALISDLGRPTTEMARVIGAVAKGDLAQKMVMEADGKPIQGEFMRTAKIVNTMVDQLGSFASEVTRVAREVGTDGKLGGQAQVKGLAGTWKDLTDNVNSMAGNLTSQMRNIAEVTTAVANGDLSKKITVDVKGEILALKNTINTMVDQLSTFSSEVTRVAREVGTEGKTAAERQAAYRQLFKHHIDTPISFATTSTAALVGGSNRATILFLNASPYRAIFHPYRPQVSDSIEATTILTRGAFSKRR